MATLQLPISRRWFNLIAVGEKKVEYRACSPHWQSRIDGKNITHIRLVNGYGAGRPWIVLEVRGISQVYRSPGPARISRPRPDDAPVGMVYAIELGDLVASGNIDMMALELMAIRERYRDDRLVSPAIAPRDANGIYTFEAGRG